MNRTQIATQALCAGLCLCFSAAVTGCAVNRSARPESPERVRPAPFGSAPAKIMLVNDQHRFVVIDFSARSLPPVGTRINVYRNGKKVGVVQLTEPTRMRLATADVLEGELRVGDEAR
jgi:hypothetical protein